MVIFSCRKKKESTMGKNSKNSLPVFVGQPVLAQILKRIRKEDVDCIASQHQSDRYVKKFSTYNHIVALLFGVMSSCDSLRELVLVLAAEQRTLLHLSIGYKVSRSTLARANGSRSPKVFEAIYLSLLLRFGGFLRDSSSRRAAAEDLFAMDSTTITLSSEILKGTGKPCYADGRQKGGIKAHAVMNAEEGVPCMVEFSKAAKGDVKFMGMACKLPKGSFVAMDKAYCGHEMFEELTRLGIWYVTRLKDNVNYSVAKELEGFKKAEGWETAAQRVIKDEIISISLPKNQEHSCRRTEYMGIVKDRNGVEREKLFVFLTNNLDIEAQTIAGIYRDRWRIELMFKRIKQNFPLKYFYGESVNAIENQIWAVLIACLLLTIAHREAKPRWTKTKKLQKLAFSSVVSLMRRLLTNYVDFSLLLSDPEMFPKIMFSRPPPEQDLFSLAGAKI
jgi:transposase